MRKRSKYKPKPVVRDVMAWVKDRTTKVSSLTEDVTLMRLHYETSLAAMAKGTGTRDDLNKLIALCNNTTALSRTYGTDWRPEIYRGATAVETIQKRLDKWGKLQALPFECADIALVLDIHSAQLDECNKADMAKALAIVESKTRDV